MRKNSLRLRVGDLVDVKETRGSGSFLKETPLGEGLILDVRKTPDVTHYSVGPFNLGDEATVHLSNGEVRDFWVGSLSKIK